MSTLNEMLTWYAAQQSTLTTHTWSYVKMLAANVGMVYIFKEQWVEDGITKTLLHQVRMETMNQARRSNEHS